jgi:hypothetical protein
MIRAGMYLPDGGLPIWLGGVQDEVTSLLIHNMK